MNQSLAITFTIEGGLPNTRLSVLDTYSSAAEVFSAPLEFVDIEQLVATLKHNGENWLITSSPDSHGFQIESPILVQYQDGCIIWDLVYEHYEPFLRVELATDADAFDENTISFTFDPFQYASALYQASQLARQIMPTTFSLPAKRTEHPVFKLASFTDRLQILWQKHGVAEQRIVNGSPTRDHDFFAIEAEKQWLQDIMDTLDEAHNDQVMENLEAYLETLPEDALSRLVSNSDQLHEILLQRWNLLINSLTQEEADALEKNETQRKFPHSLKLRLIKEFIDGNPSILLGNAFDPEDSPEKVIDMANWRDTHPHP